MNQEHLFARDYYTISIFKIINSGETIELKLVKECFCADECLVRFKQSPYIGEEIMVLSDKSSFYQCSLINPETL